MEAYGRLDYAFNNAGIGPDGVRVPLGSIVDLPVEIWDRTIDTNLKGVFLCLKYEMKQMMKQGSGGAIVNTSSGGGGEAGPGFLRLQLQQGGPGQPHQVRGPGGRAVRHPRERGPARAHPEHPAVGAPHRHDAREAGQNHDSSFPCSRIGFPEDVAEAVM